VRITYLQVSRDTFIELLPVAADQPAGILHVGIETEDLSSSVANLRARGITVAEPTVGASKAQVARITDADGVNIEVMQMGPDSMQRQAIEAWR
jgi:4-hydroxyphenylpyruvate dioxygenase-like putative hemolysin